MLCCYHISNIKVQVFDRIGILKLRVLDRLFISNTDQWVSRQKANRKNAKNPTKYKLDKMQNRHNANITKCKYNKM